MKKNEKKKKSFQWTVLRVAAVYWMFPFLMILGMASYYLFSDQVQQRVRGAVQQVEANAESAAATLDRAVELSREATEDGILRELLERKNQSGDYQTQNDMNLYLTRKYKKKTEFQCVMFWDTRDEEHISASIYNSSAGGSYGKIDTYWEKDHETVAAYAREIDTKIAFVNQDGRLYMVRNIVSRDYQSMGTLVMRLNVNKCFDGLMRFAREYETDIKINDCVLHITEKQVEGTEEMPKLENTEKGNTWRDGKLWVTAEPRTKGYTLSVVSKIPKGLIFDSIYSYLVVLALLLAVLIPLLYTLLYLVKRHILNPMKELLAGAHEIQEGNLGFQITKEADNQEFQYLTDSFNAMSEKLKYQFEHLYQEELALRDARIKALQAHINTHFMNNTLEIINWEARLEGNVKVSKMIEALSVLMNAAMDRKSCPKVTLREEMTYVEAYLHIMGERLGSRLKVSVEIQEEAMDFRIPRLILQPVIENAIEHGVIPYKEGLVVMRSQIQGEYLYLDILNSGVLTEEEKEKIRQLLNPDYDTSRESFGNLGIANVNQRLAIMYGNGSGLQVFQKEDDQICSRLTIFVGKKEQ